MSPLSLDVARLSKLSHRARVLAFIRVLLHAGHITRAQASLLKDITFEGCAFLEAAVELLCIDGNVDECGYGGCGSSPSCVSFCDFVPHQMLPVVLPADTRFARCA